jgi:hypothetical protein
MSCVFLMLGSRLICGATVALGSADFRRSHSANSVSVRHSSAPHHVPRAITRVAMSCDFLMLGSRLICGATVALGSADVLGGRSYIYPRIQMGYTHYYHLLDTDTEFAEMFLQANKIVEIANSSGVQVCVLKLNEDMASFSITGTDSDNTCETFDWPPMNKFCKTARLPYDTAVGVCLLVAKQIYQARVYIGSDGEWDCDEWEDAKQLYTAIYKNEPDCPFEN